MTRRHPHPSILALTFAAFGVLAVRPAGAQDDAPAEEPPPEEAEAPEASEEAAGEEASEGEGGDAAAPDPDARPAQPLPRAARLPAPKVRSIAFLDPYPADARLSGEASDCPLVVPPDCEGEGCYEVPPQRGGCTERVRFAPLPLAFTGEDPFLPADFNPEEDKARTAWRALTRNTASLYMANWDGIAMRWFRGDDPIASTIKASPIEALPQPSDTWLQARPEDRRLISLPHRNSWLDEARWVDDRDTAYEDPFFPLVEVHPVAGEGDPGGGIPRAALLKGRFAERLGFNNQPHPFEIMDADEESSGPFFEQIFPYNTARRADRPTSIRPLARFQDARQLQSLASDEDVAALNLQPHEVPIFLEADALNEFEERVQASFEEFSRLIGVSVARYALRDHTINQMRILTALTAMRSPPDAAVLDQGRYRGLVAAARGETDSDAQLGFDFQRQLGGISGGIDLRLRTLPPAVRDAWLNRLVAEAITSSAETRPRLRMGADEILEEAEYRLRNDAVVGPLGLRTDIRLGGLSTGDIDAFLNEAVTQKSRLRPFVFEDARAIVLGAVLGGLELDTRDTYETLILLDHFDFSIAEQRRSIGGAPQPPAAVAAAGEGQFSAVLEAHGRTSNLVPQGLQAVDPLAICTREPGRAALAEPTFKPVMLDLIVHAPDPDGTVDAATVLWAARDQVPFLAVDDPEASVPMVTQLADLPGPDALYRIRWRLWSGWHILWSPEAVGEQGRTRLAARTAAVCENMVLTAPALVPTVLRGGLLSGELFPTEPFRWGDMQGKDRRVAKQNLRREGMVDPTVRIPGNVTVGGAVQTGSKAAAQAEEIQTQGAGSMQGTDGLSKAGDMERRYRPSVLVGNRVQEMTPGQTATYLRGIVNPHLRALSKELGGLILMVFDHAVADDGRPLGDAIKPRTPYRRVHRPARGPAREVRSAGWALWIPADGTPIARIGPAWRETDRVSNDNHPVPRWKPRRPGDWTMTSSLGVFPYRQVWQTCTDDPTWFDSVAPCETQWVSETDPRTSTRSEGFGFDLGGMYAWWLSHRPRVALESGLEGRFDIVPRGRVLLYEDEPEFAWTFRFAGGPMFGLRFAGRPSSLWRLGKKGSTWGPQRPEGGNRVARTQWGIRGGALFSPGFSGAEITGVIEAWYGRSIRNVRSTHQSFTPYHPSVVLGPFVRGQYTTLMPLIEPTPGHLVLDRAWTVIVGAKLNLRIKAQGPTLPPVE